MTISLTPVNCIRTPTSSIPISFGSRLDSLTLTSSRMSCKIQLSFINQNQIFLHVSYSLALDSCCRSLGLVSRLMSSVGNEQVPGSYFLYPVLPFEPVFPYPDGQVALQHAQLPVAPPPPPPMIVEHSAHDQTDIMSIIPILRCWSCAKCGNLNYAHRLTCNLRKCQKMSEHGGDTDWVCACGNMNYKFRKYCNLRKCQLPQIGNPYLFYGINQLIQKGYSPQTALSLLLTNTSSIESDHPFQQAQPPRARKEASQEGCWTCQGCGNLNWPWREDCNRKSCGFKKFY
jgi:hypothetical protein